MSVIETILIIVLSVVFLLITIGLLVVLSKRNLRISPVRSGTFPEESPPQKIAEKQLFYKCIRNENGRIQHSREVIVTYFDSGELLFYCCDIATWIDKQYGDPGLEFYVKTDQLNTLKFLQVLLLESGRSIPDSPEAIPEMEYISLIAARFGGREEGFDEIMPFYEENDIRYRFERW